MDAIYIRFVHTSGELPRVGRQRLHESALALLMNGVKYEAALARTAYSGNDHQLIPWDVQFDVFEVVFSGAMYCYLMVLGTGHGVGGYPDLKLGKVCLSLVQGFGMDHRENPGSKKSLGHRRKYLAPQSDSFPTDLEFGCDGQTRGILLQHVKQTMKTSPSKIANKMAGSAEFAGIELRHVFS